MGFTVELHSRSEREVQIKKAIESSSQKIKFYDFRSVQIDIPVIRLDINLPIYRMENFRTFTDHKEYVIGHELDDVFFINGQELESVQQIQHEILAKLARKGVADSVVPVTEVLKNEGQREPILITSSGVVVNGNRRLAAMRELFAEDTSKYAVFSYVDCVVLPSDTTANEIVDIEASLQAKQETKLEYDWICDAQLIHKLQTMGRTTGQIADQLNRAEREIKNSLQALVEADLYLKDWVGCPGQYSKVTDDAKQVFKDLPKQLNGKGQELTDASRVIAWTLFDNKDKLPERIYAFSPIFGKRAEDVLERLSETLTLSKDSGDDSEGQFDIDFTDDEIKSYESIINAFRNEDTKEKAVEALIEISQEILETERGQKTGEAALRALALAHAKIISIDLSLAAPDTYMGIKSQLIEIEKNCKILSEKLSNYLED